MAYYFFEVWYKPLNHYIMTVCASSEYAAKEHVVQTSKNYQMHTLSAVCGERL